MPCGRCFRCATNPPIASCQCSGCAAPTPPLTVPFGNSTNRPNQVTDLTNTSPSKLSPSQAPFPCSHGIAAPHAPSLPHHYISFCQHSAPAPLSSQTNHRRLNHSVTSALCDDAAPTLRLYLHLRRHVLRPTTTSPRSSSLVSSSRSGSDRVRLPVLLAGSGAGHRYSRPRPERRRSNLHTIAWIPPPFDLIVDLGGQLGAVV